MFRERRESDKDGVTAADYTNININIGKSIGDLQRVWGALLVVISRYLKIFSDFLKLNLIFSDRICIRGFILDSWAEKLADC